jgi:hypothetical protein
LYQLALVLVFSAPLRKAIRGFQLIFFEGEYTALNTVQLYEKALCGWDFQGDRREAYHSSL